MYLSTCFFDMFARNIEVFGHFLSRSLLIVNSMFGYEIIIISHNICGICTVYVLGRTSLNQYPVLFHYSSSCGAIQLTNSQN